MINKIYFSFLFFIPFPLMLTFYAHNQGSLFCLVFSVEVLNTRTEFGKSVVSKLHLTARFFNLKILRGEGPKCLGEEGAMESGGGERGGARGVRTCSIRAPLFQRHGQRIYFSFFSFSGGGYFY